MIKAYFLYEKSKFPAGEVHISLLENLPDQLNVYADIRSSDDFFELLLLSDAVRRKGREIDVLTISYLPYSRQDRVCNQGESLSLKVSCDLINYVNANKVCVIDPHSDVSTALIDRSFAILPNELPGWASMVRSKTIICPDAGAEKKMRRMGLEYVLCTKNRDTKTGDISETMVHSDKVSGTCLIVDDICDGGATFINLAKELKNKGAAKVELYVSHGIFSRGKEVFKDLIDSIYTEQFKEIIKCC